MELYPSGATVQLSLLLDDGAVDQYPQATVRLASTGAVAALVDLAHVADGLYKGAWTPATDGPYLVVHTIYSDAGHTTPNTDYGRELESWAAGAYVLPKVGLIEKLLRNRLELAEGTTNNWVLYDDDSITPLLRWSVTDKTGLAIALQSTVPAKRTRGA